MNSEKIVFEILSGTSGGGSHSQKGDVSQHLLEQGFFDEKTMPESLKNRQKLPSGGNPVDVKKDFFKQNPN